MSAIGEFLREIMPSWLNRPGTLRPSVRRAPGSDDARVLAREADAVWQQSIDEGLHGEAFPEPITGKSARPAGKQEAARDSRDKPSGSNGPH